MVPNQNGHFSEGITRGIAKGLSNDIGTDRRMQIGCIGIVEAEERDEGEEYLDDLNGKK